MPDQTPGRTIVETFWQNAERYGPRPALRRRAGHEWETLTWEDYAARVSDVAAGLIRLGLAAGDTVGVLSGNRREWHIADLGILAAAGVTVPVYPTNSSSQVAFVLEHAECRFLFVEDLDQLSKVLLRRHELPHLERVFVFDRGDGLDHDFVSDLDELEDLAAEELAEHPTVLEDRAHALGPDDLATIVYTSGTTGHPKGAMLTHGNLAANIDNITQVVPVGPDDRFLSFLPLSHIAERTVSDFGQVLAGGETWFAQSLASVQEDLVACRPTIFFAVPRVWEKFREGIREHVTTLPGPKRVLAERYLHLAARSGRVTGSGAVLSRAERLQHKALDGLVGRTIRAQLGLDKTRYLVCAAAPVHPDLLRWFHGLGLPVAEVYGQTENCGVSTMNPPGAIRVGTVGTAVPGVEVRIAEDGEVLSRGGNVTIGYHRDDIGTAELLDDEGWMHTGDLGVIDAEGYLSITGRKKDVIINAAGKNISPQEIETRLRYEPLISQAVVIGDGRPYLTALLTLDSEALREWGEHHGRSGSVEALCADPEVLAAVADSVDRVNLEHARVEGIKRWHVLPADLTVASGELTPTLKVKRNVVAERYTDEIEALYAR
ncbi:MAG TPA: long-chain fatty acid--CoA ligase [Acidimicrobiales bacterium]